MPYPELAHALKRWKARGGRTRWIADALGVKYEMARRYVEGKAMPRQQKMKKLAALIGVPAAELHYGKKLDPRRTPGLATVPVSNVTPEEQILLETYRRLPPAAQGALRVRASELLEEFGRKSEVNPFGKGSH